MARQDFSVASLVSITINGVPAGGSADFSEEFTYRVTSPDELSVLNKGTDGATTHIATDKSAELEISLKPTSTVNDFLNTLLSNQNSQAATLFPINIISGVNENLSFNKCAIKKGADLEDTNTTFGSRIWSFTCQEFQRSALSS